MPAFFPILTPTNPPAVHANERATGPQSGCHLDPSRWLGLLSSCSQAAPGCTKSPVPRAGSQNARRAALKLPHEQ